MAAGRIAWMGVAMVMTGLGLAGPATADPSIAGDYVFESSDAGYRQEVDVTSCGEACLTMDFGDGDVVEYRLVNEAWTFTRWKDDAVTCDSGRVVGAEQTTSIDVKFTSGRNVASADCGDGMLPMRPATFSIRRAP